MGSRRTDHPQDVKKLLTSKTSNVMAIFYKLQYRKNLKKPAMSGYFAVVSSKGLVTTDTIADEIQRNCSMKRSDVLAVLAELSEVIRLNIQQSQSVKLDGIGIFRPGISSRLVESVALFDPRNCVRGMRLNFLPESMTVGGKRVKKVFAGAHLVQEQKLRVDVAPEGTLSEGGGSKTQHSAAGDAPHNDGSVAKGGATVNSLPESSAEPSPEAEPSPGAETSPGKDKPAEESPAAEGKTV